MAVLLLAAPGVAFASPPTLAIEQAKPAARKPSTQKPAARKPAAKPVPKRIAQAPTVTCPQVLGLGLGSRLRFCEVMTSLNPAEGIIVKLPPHKGPLTFTFDLHNRHTYSEQEVKAGRAYAQYTATIGVLTMDGTLLARGVVQNEFRTEEDLFDRITGGAGPGGVKAVAPTGMERIVVEIPENVNEVSLLGEKLAVVTLAGRTLHTAAQRPIAAVSNLSIEFQPAPAKPAPKRPVRRK